MPRPLYSGRGDFFVAATKLHGVSRWVEGEEVLGMLREYSSLVDLTMKIVEEGSGNVLPTVELKVEGLSVNKLLKELII